MLSAFRELLAQSFDSAAALDQTLSELTVREWQPVAELFNVRLPEFDALYAMPGTEILGLAIANARGVPEISTQGWPESPGELLILTTQLKDGLAEETVMNQARQMGWQVRLVAAAVEHTSLNGRARLTQHSLVVRAAVQVASTPRGLTFERRSPERWAS